MLTNVFRIGGLHQVSWFQLVAEGDVLSPNSIRTGRSWQDSTAMQVMRAHIWLQEAGNLSSWTLSDDKVKLWLFLPGRHDSLNRPVHVAVTGLKVVGSGLWRAPGECSEIASALAQALRNRIERGFRSVSYVRFGDVFVKCLPQSTKEFNLRKSLFSCELVFSASEEAIFVHVLVRRKRVRQLVMGDLQAAIAQQRSNSGVCDNSLAVIVAPNGLSGRLSGCCPDDLVTQLYQSKLQAFNASTLPVHVVGSTSASGTISVQPFFAEVSLEQLKRSTRAMVPSLLGVTETKLPKNATYEADSGHVLIYPLDAVLVPMWPAVPSQSSIRSFWLQEWTDGTWLESGMDEETPALDGGAGMSSYSSGGCSSSSSSSQGSSGTSSSSDADGHGLGETEADADSTGSKAAGALISKHTNMRASATPLHGLNLDSGDMKSAHVAYTQGTKRGRAKPLVGVGACDPPPKAVKRSNSVGDILGLIDGPSNDKRSVEFLGESSGFGSGMSSSMRAGTSRGGGSQLGNPWDQWDNDGSLGMGLGMDVQSDADILAEFGDFGDFFEDDGLGFGEPPDTAESQALMLSLPDYGEVSQTPGTAPLDATDPMVLPILDFPLLETNHDNGDLVSDMKLYAFIEVSQASTGGHPYPQPASALDLRLKSEALFCYAPGFEAVDMADVPDAAAFRDPYIPVSKKSADKSAHKKQYYYAAIPPLYAKVNRFDVGKDVQGSNESPTEYGDIRKEKTAGYTAVSDSRGSWQLSLNGKELSTEGTGPESLACTPLASNKQPADASGTGTGCEIPGHFVAAQSSSAADHVENKESSSRSAVAVLATDLECALLQVMMCRFQDSSSVFDHSCRSGVSSPGNEVARGTSLLLKDIGPDISQVQLDNLAQSGRGLERPQQEGQKVPERIAGHAEADIFDAGKRVAQVGVWRPVGGSNALQQFKSTTTNNINAVDSCLGVSSISSPVNPGMNDLAGSNSRQGHWQEILEAVSLLAQQASIAIDVSLDGQCGDGPFGWLAAQEIQRQQYNCRADCSQLGRGSMLATTSCLDQSGMEIFNPLSAEISAATVASLLQSDVRVAMSNAFGEAAADGPLALVDWCKSRVHATDRGLWAESTNTDSKEMNSTITIAGEPMTPSQPGGCLKGTDMDDMRRSSSSCRANDSSHSDQTDPSKRRGPSDDLGLSRADTSGYHEPTIVALPTPSLLVGYQDDWLQTSSTTLHLWEKAPLEPYALSKQVNYHVICFASELLVTAAADFFQQLSSVYELCRLGSHMPSGTAAGQSELSPGSSTQNLPGFTLVDVPEVPYSSVREGHLNAIDCSLAKAYAASMTVNWNMAAYRKALRKVCKALPISSGCLGSQRDPEQGSCTVVYVVCPVSDPAGILQTMVDACSSLGSAITGADCQRHAAFATGEDGLPLNILGFSIPRFALQLVTADTIFRTSGSRASSLDVLKEIALGVFNKVRRIPRCAQRTDCLQKTGVDTPGTRSQSGISLSFQSNASLSGLWKNCSTQHSNGNATMGTLDSGNNISMWKCGWGPSMLTDLGTTGEDATHETIRYLYEPAYILAEYSASNSGVGLAPARTLDRDATRDDASAGIHGAIGVPGSGSDVGSTATNETLDGDTSATAQQSADLHCCYTWSGNWNWLVSVWTDARGELLDTQLLPLTGVDTERESCLLVLFNQILQQGLQLLNLAIEAGIRKPRGLNITRLGGFYDRECEGWHRVIMSAGADDIRKWPIQIRHPHCDTSGNVGVTGSIPDMGLMTERGLGLAGSGPTAPSPSSSFGGRGKASHYSKSGAELSSGIKRRQNQATNQMSQLETTKGAFQWVRSICLVSVRVDQSLQIVSTTDGPPQGNSLSAPSWPAGSISSGVMGMGVNPVRAPSSTGAYLVVPSHVNRPLAPSLQLLFKSPCSDQSALAQYLNNSGPACPVTTAFVVSGGTASTVTDFIQRGMKEDWPSTMSVGLVAYYSASSRLGSSVQDDGHESFKVFKSTLLESKELALEAHRILQVAASELHALSWLNVGLTYVHRRSPLPFHCEVAQRFQLLLGFLDSECESGLTIS